MLAFQKYSPSPPSSLLLLRLLRALCHLIKILTFVSFFRLLSVDTMVPEEVTPWKDSEAKKLLYKDLLSGDVDDEMQAK